ncbi:MAG TPA: glycosyltransferase family A protein [Ohtaekwangia sp.]|nr:glycosyltransferase family A protein [Ohtaekwangia sp.]
MTLDDINDDLALAKKPFRVVAALAVHGRLPLLEHTIRRLYQKNGCVKVICAGDNPEDKVLCESLGAVWVHIKNRFLGDKWNAAFKKAKDFNPDAVLFVGSSDWVSDNWFSVMEPYVEKYGFAGVPGCFLADLGEEVRLCHWSGYAFCRPERADETIGIGRMLSRRLLDALNWEPFSPILKNSLDRSMKDRAKTKGYVDHMVMDSRLKAMSLSTSLWPNKHRFSDHWEPNGRAKSARMLPDEFLRYNFPEAIELYETLKPMIDEKIDLERRTSIESSHAAEDRVQNLPV